MIPDSFYDGYANALLYLQAHYDREGGQQTIKSHFPNELWNGEDFERVPDFKERLDAALHRLNNECMITSWRYVIETEEIKFADGEVDKYEVELIEIGGSDGYFGPPNWDDPDSPDYES